MDVEASDGALLIYNYAVVLSGGAIVTSLNVSSQTGLLVVGLAVSVFWTVYFKIGMLPRIQPESDSTK